MSLVISIFVRGGEGAGVCLISGGGERESLQIWDLQRLASLELCFTVDEENCTEPAKQ